MHAVDLFEQGVIPAEIARQVGRWSPNRVGLAHGLATGWSRWRPRLWDLGP
jgi:hypothetical protein